MSDVQQLLEGFMSGDIATTSELKLRDENIQKKFRGTRLKGLKKEPRKKSKLLVMTELAIPFNPFTGKEDDTYNRDNKFRPTLAESTVMKTLKEYCRTHEDIKKVFMQKSGVTEWNIDNVDTITKEDRKVFQRYRVPRKFTLPVCKVNIPIFTGNAFGRDYLINVKRDELTQQIEGEMPLLLKVNKLMNDMAYEEILELNQKIKDGSLTLNDKDKKAEVSKIYDKVVVSADYPVNYVVAVELALNGKSDLEHKEDIRALEPSDMLGKLVLVKCTKEVENALDKYLLGDYEAIDLYPDFWEFDMNCSSDEDKKELGKNTRYEKAMNYLSDYKGVEEFQKSFAKCVDETPDWEKIFMNSVFVSKFDDSMEDSFLDAVSSVIDLDSPFLTAKVVNANADIITLIYGDEGEAKVAEAASGLMHEGNLDEAKSEQEGKANVLDIMNVLETDDNVEADEIELNIE